MEIKNISFIGLGALGILFGNQISKTVPKENLRFIADKERIAKYEKEKIYCNGKACDFNYVTPDILCEPADLLIITVKFQGLESALESIKNHVGKDTIILSALNGISSEEIIGNTYGMDKMLYCVAQGMDAVKVGNELTYHHTGLLCIGEKEPGIISERVKKVSEFFDKTKVPYEAVANMHERLWGKFMLNVGVNQTVAVYGTSYADIFVEEKPREIMIGAMREVMALAKMEGVLLTEDDLNYWLNVLGTLSGDGKPSMRQDIEAKRYSEVELFAGTVLKLGKKHNIPTPINQELYKKIKEIESFYK